MATSLSSSDNEIADLFQYQREISQGRNCFEFYSQIRKMWNISCRRLSKLYQNPTVFMKFYVWVFSHR